MKKSKLIATQEFLKRNSKEPWACFETDGMSEGGVGVGMHWNAAFIQHLHAQGIQGTNEQETLQLFFLFMSTRIAESLVGEDVINPEGTPNLTSEANTFIR